jgi:hypothetical protein
MFFKYISIKVFLISLALGLLFVYLSTPTPTIIYVYPTPDNVDRIEYKDKASNCFKFKADEVKCPADKNAIKKIPVQKSVDKGSNNILD